MWRWLTLLFGVFGFVFVFCGWLELVGVLVVLVGGLAWRTFGIWVLAPIVSWWFSGCLVFGGGGLVYFSVWRWFWGLRFLLCVGFSVGWSAGTVLRFVGLVGVGFWCLCVLVGGLRL